MLGLLLKVSDMGQALHTHNEIHRHLGTQKRRVE